MVTASIIILIITCFIHLLFCFLEKEKARKATKCLIFPGLLCLMYSLGVDNILVYLGLAFGIVGDFFLLYKNKAMFITGGILFLCGHFCYIASFISLLSYKINYLYFILIGICLIVLILIFNPSFKKVLGSISWATIGYGYTLILGMVFGLLLCFDKSSTFSFLPFVGMILFLISDSILIYKMFIKDFRRRDFYVMITYIGAQLSICLGIALL